LSLMSRDRQNRPILLRLAVADRQWTVQALPEHLSGNGMDWAPSWNELFFYNAGDPAYSLMRADLDTGRQDVVWQPPRHPILALGATADGRHLAFTIRQRIWIFDRQTGTGRQIPDVAAIPYGLSWSPDGRHLLYTGTDHPGTNSAEGRFDHDTLRLRMLDVATGRSTDVRGTDSLIATSEPGAIREPAWAPDGARIAFSLNVATFEMRMLDDPLAGVGSPRTRRRQR
jgi:Tol biopolymer transport system component